MELDNIDFLLAGFLVANYLSKQYANPDLPRLRGFSFNFTLGLFGKGKLEKGEVVFEILSIEVSFMFSLFPPISFELN